MRFWTSLFAIFVVSTCAVRAQAPLRAGDSVEIRLSGVVAEFANEFSQVYNIDNRGLVNLPYIGEVRAQGLLPNQLQTDIQNRLVAEKIYTNPTITVSTESAPRFVNVSGAVKGGGRIPYTPDMTLMRAISAAGGFNEFADEKKVILTREGRPSAFNAKEIKRGRQEDPKILPGDQIDVGTTWGFQSF